MGAKGLGQFVARQRGIGQAAQKRGRHGLGIEVHAGEDGGRAQAVIGQIGAAIDHSVRYVLGKPFQRPLQNLALRFGIHLLQTGQPGLGVIGSKGKCVGDHRREA